MHLVLNGLLVCGDGITAHLRHYHWQPKTCSLVLRYVRLDEFFHGLPTVVFGVAGFNIRRKHVTIHSGFYYICMGGCLVPRRNVLHINTIEYPNRSLPRKSSDSATLAPHLPHAILVERDLPVLGGVTVSSAKPETPKFRVSAWRKHWVFPHFKCDLHGVYSLKPLLVITPRSSHKARLVVTPMGRTIVASTLPFRCTSSLCEKHSTSVTK